MRDDRSRRNFGTMASRSSAPPTRRYRHTQRNAGVLVLFGLAGAGPLVSLALLGIRSIPLAPRLTLAAAALAMIGSGLLFSALTIVVDDERLTWHFAAGLLGKSVPLADITGAEATMTRWMEGIGVHLTTRGWLYNVGGRGAVLVTLRDGKRFLLGTDEPAALVQALGSPAHTTRP